ncbi:MAG: hypothetical protein EHM58_09895 [Ignavibacteriae bacterium]|nr:MAG: hypothetical protein EHM58_09895 [Ignavibacteriota bacterium]
MKKLFTVIFLLVLYLSCTVYFNSCGTDTTTNPQTPGSSNNNSYTLSNNYGDIVKLTVKSASNKDNITALTYEWINQSLNMNGNGTMTLETNPNLAGVYKTSDGNYIIEQPDSAFISSIQFCRPESKIGFGITSEKNLNTLTLTGDYIFINYAQDTIDAFGGYSIKSDGTFTWGLAPYDISTISNFNYFQGGGSGTWAVSSSDSSIVIFNSGGVNIEGVVYPGKYMIIGDEVNHCVTVGIKYPSVPVDISQVAGTYRGFDYTNDGNVGVGFYTMPSTAAQLPYYFSYNNPPLISQGISSGNVTRHPGINNCFVVRDIKPGEWDFNCYVIMLSGECLLHFARSNIGNQGSNSCGFCLKIN